MHSKLYILVFLLLLPAVSGDNLTLAWESNAFLHSQDNDKNIKYSEAQAEGFGTQVLVGVVSNFYLYSGASSPSLQLLGKKLTYMDTIDYSASGRLGSVVSASNTRAEVHRLEEDYPNLWNVSLDNIRGVEAGDVDSDGYSDDLLIRTSTRLYAFKPREDRELFHFNLGSGAQVMEILNSSILMGYGNEGEGVLKSYDRRGRITWRYNFSQPVEGLVAFDADSDGREDEVAVRVGGGSENFVFSSEREVMWKYYDIPHTSKCDFDQDGIRDDLLALGDGIRAYNSRGEILSTYSLEKIGATNTPTSLEGGTCLVFNADDIADDAAIVGYVSKQGYFVYGIEDIAHEEAEEEEGGNKAPVAEAGSDRVVNESEEVILSALNSSDPDGEIVAYIWKEKGRVLSYNPAFSTWLELGTHVIILEVRDDDGSTSMDSVTVRVVDQKEEEENAPPVAEAGKDKNLSLGSPANFSASASHDPDGEIVSYQWSFEGELISTQKSFSYSFPQGENTVKLTVVDDRGAEDSDQLVVSVLPPREEGYEYTPYLQSLTLTGVAFLLGAVVFLRRHFLG